MRKILLLFVAISFTAFAQITITGSDISGMFAVGNTFTIHIDTTQTMMDIGSTGGGNNWNFTSLVSDLMSDQMCINPISSPYSNSFPGADFCIYNTASAGGFTSESWTFSSLNGFFDNMGSATTVVELPGYVTTIVNDPARHAFMIPTTYNSQWMETFTQTTYLNGAPLTSTSISLNTIVDAYGTMTIPGGASYDALRIRETTTIGGSASVGYTFVAKNGAQVSLDAVDPNPPTSGVINIDGGAYNGALGSSSVEQISNVPLDYNLSQNYPNPFNPSTNIQYSIPEASFVQLKVYDVLGNEVADLVNEQQTAGTYRADFSGEGLASGLYIARLTAGNFTSTVKMTLMK